MPEGIPVLLFIGFVLFVAGVQWWEKRAKLKKTAHVVVHEGREYPNNHNLVGVGYYHATARKWCSLPWNEFREDRGYFWDGDWHEKPDLRQVAASTPEGGEIARVNQVWRQAETSHIKQFGFGISEQRANGS